MSLFPYFKLCKYMFNKKKLRKERARVMEGCVYHCLIIRKKNSNLVAFDLNDPK